MPVTAKQHWDSLKASGMLTEWFRRIHRPAAMKVQPEKVVKLLNGAKIKFVLMGTHGLNAYRDEPRATHDVDLLVAARDQKKAIKALTLAFPKLKVEETPIVTRFIDPTTGRGVIDLMKPTFPLHEAAFANAVAFPKLGMVPTLELAIASKFAAMISPHRRKDKKMVDGGDFMNIIQTSGQNLDREKLHELGELVYAGGGAELLRYVDDAIADRTLIV